MKCSIPVITACSGVEIGPQKIPGHSGTEEGPAINLSLSIGIPVTELLAALSSFQLLSSPAPAEVPDCSFRPKKPPVDIASRRGNPGGSTRWESIPQHVGPRVILGGADAPAGQGPSPAPSGPPPTPPGTARLTSLSRPSRPGRGFTVKVSNISKRVRPEELQQVFEEHVGPVIDISMFEETARLTFASRDSARKAIDEYDGGILEAFKHEQNQSSPDTDPSLTLYPRSSSLSLLEERLGPLTRCHLRRGEGWITIFRAAITKQLKKEDGMNQIDFKGSFIQVCIDTSMESTLIDSFGYVVGGHPVEL